MGRDLGIFCERVGVEGWVFVLTLRGCLAGGIGRCVCRAI